MAHIITDELSNKNISTELFLNFPEMFVFCVQTY